MSPKGTMKIKIQLCISDLNACDMVVFLSENNFAYACNKCRFLAVPQRKKSERLPVEQFCFFRTKV